MKQFLTLFTFFAIAYCLSRPHEGLAQKQAVTRPVAAYPIGHSIKGAQRKPVSTPTRRIGKSTGNKSIFNDNCQSATDIQYGVLITDSATQANDQSEDPITCGTFTSSAAFDSWYTFTKTAAMDTLFVVPMATDDPVLQLYNGSCTGLAYIGCSDLGGVGTVEGFVVTDLVNGITYTMRAYGYNGTDCRYDIFFKSAEAPTTVPPNDACSASQVLVANVLVSGYNAQATQQFPPVECSTFTSSQANDVWYAFTKTAGMDSILLQPATADLILELRSNSCTAGTSIDCKDEKGSGGQEKMYIGNLINGTTYRIRVYGWNASTGTFTIKVKASAANDNCENAVQLTASASCSGVLNGTTVGSTQSLPAITCNELAGIADDDVWYTFVKQSQMDSLIVVPGTTSSGTFDPVVDLRTGSCASNFNVLCSDATSALATERIYLGGITNGTQCYVRIYGYGGGDASAGTFGICLKTISSVPPVNDNCAQATVLTAGVSVGGTTFNATQSLPAITCGAFTSPSANEVWFRFTKTSAMDTLVLTPDGFDPVVDVRTNNCTTGINLLCADLVGNITEKIALSSLTDGVTYLVRVYGYNGASGNFTLLLKDALVAPPNNECDLSVLLSAGVSLGGTTINATQSLPPITCGPFTSSVANDVWYRFVKSAATDTLVINPLDFDPVVEIRTNDCSTGVNVACADVGSNLPEKIVLTGLTNGTTYLARVYGWAGVEGSFTVLLKDAGVVAPPQNDACALASLLTVGTSCQFVAGTNIGATATALLPATCAGTQASEAKDVWYSFVANGTGAIIHLECGIGFDGTVAAYSGTCTSPAQIGCADVLGASSSGFIQTEEVILSGLTLGQTYRIRVHGYQGGEGTFGICVYNPGCTSSIGTVSANVSSVISNQSFTVSTTGVAGGVHYEYSSDQTNWFTYNGLDDALDTMNFSGTISGSLYLRAVGQTGNCFPAYSPVVTLPFSCATQFVSPTIGDYIKRVAINTINQTSVRNFYGGNVQDFKNVSTTLCRGNNYPLVIETNFSGVPYNRMAWVDFNQDGDYGDAGENVVFGPYVTSATGPTQSFDVPLSATLGTTKMRVAIINNGAAITSANPCEVGSYNMGEIEEYTVIISAGVVSNAGPAQTVCGVATLAGNSPGAGNTGTWSVVSGSGTFANANQFNTTVSGLSNGANIFRWTIVSGCGTAGSNVTITQSTITANAGQNQSVCAATTSLSATPPTSGNGVWTLASGAGNIVSANVANTNVTGLGLGVNAFVWSVSSTVPGCSTATDTVYITRTAEPSNANAGLDQALCGTATAISGNVPTVGTAQWSVLQGGGTIANPNEASTTVSGMTSGTNRFRWTISNGSCTPKTDEITVLVTEAPVANAGQDQVLCQPAAQLTGNAPANSTSLWTLLSGTGTLSNPTSSSTLISDLGMGQSVFVYTLSRVGCPSDQDTIIITRKAQPNAFAGVDQTICTNTATLGAFAPSEGTGIWTLVSGSGQITTPGSPTTQVTGLAVGANTFRWTVSNPPCQAAFDEVTITTSGNAVAANAGNDATVCAANYNLVGNAPGSGTGLWTVVSGSGTIVSPGLAATQVTGLGTGINVFRWTITNGVCPPSSDEVLITRSAGTTIANAGSDQSICTNAATLSGNVPLVGSGMWTVVSGAGVFSDATNPATTVTGLGTGNNILRWTITNAPCASSTDEVTIATTSSATTSSAGVDQTVCSAGAILSANVATQGAGTWSVVSGAGVFGDASNPATTVSALGVGTNVFRWTIVNGNCPPSTDEVSIVRKQEAATPDAGPDQNICTSTATLSASAVSVGLGTWSLVLGTGTLINPNASSTAVSGLGAGDNTFRFTITNAPCQPVWDDVVINSTLAATTSMAGSDQTICASSTTLSGNTPQAGTGQWVVVSGSATLADPNAPNTMVSNLQVGTTVFRWTITSGACPPSTDEVSITVQAVPTLANAGNDQTICGSTATLGANLPSAGTGRWTVVSGAGVFINENDPLSQVINLGNGTNTLRWTVSNAPCPATQDEVVISSTPPNVTANAGTDKTVCGATANLTATSPTTGSGSWSLISGGGLISQPGQAVTSVSGLVAGANQFLWTVVDGNCTATDVVLVTREVNPVNLGPDTLFCIETTSSYLLTGPVGMPAYQWNTAATSSQITVSQTGTYSLRVTTPNQCVFNDTVAVTFSVCTGTDPALETAKSTIRIVPNPSAGAARIRLLMPETGNVDIEVYDMRGVKHTHFLHSVFEGTNEIQLPSGLASGMYAVRVTGMQHTQVMYWIVER